MTRKFCVRQTYQFTQLIKVVSLYNDILSRERVNSPKIGPPMDPIIEPTNSAAHCGSHSGKAPLDVLTTSAFMQVFSCNEKQLKYEYATQEGGWIGNLKIILANPHNKQSNVLIKIESNKFVQSKHND